MPEHAPPAVLHVFLTPLGLEHFRAGPGSHRSDQQSNYLDHPNVETRVHRVRGSRHPRASVRHAAIQRKDCTYPLGTEKGAGQFWD